MFLNGKYSCFFCFKRFSKWIYLKGIPRT